MFYKNSKQDEALGLSQMHLNTCPVQVYPFFTHKGSFDEGFKEDPGYQICFRRFKSETFDSRLSLKTVTWVEGCLKISILQITLFQIKVLFSVTPGKFRIRLRGETEHFSSWRSEMALRVFLASRTISVKRMYGYLRLLFLVFKQDRVARLPAPLLLCKMCPWSAGNANKVSSITFKPQPYVSAGLCAGSGPRPRGAPQLIEGSALDVIMSDGTEKQRTCVMCQDGL